MSFVARILLLTTLALSSGCYFRASITGPAEPVSSVSTPLSENHGYVANAKTSYSTVLGYRKNTSIGYFQGETVKTSTVKSYWLQRWWCANF